MFATSASARVGVIAPWSGVFGLNGPSNRTPNHSPNSFESETARQTRERGARSVTVFWIRSEMTVGIGNLSVAYLITRRAHMQPYGCLPQREGQLDGDPHGDRRPAQRAGTEAPLPRRFQRFLVEPEHAVERPRDA